jgi:hypothetical protein
MHLRFAIFRPSQCFKSLPRDESSQVSHNGLLSGQPFRRLDPARRLFPIRHPALPTACHILGVEPMADVAALKKEKQDLIEKMLVMQKQFIDHEHEHGVSGKDYWASKDGLLANFRHEYNDMANRVVDLAHQIVGSSR